MLIKELSAGVIQPVCRPLWLFNELCLIQRAHRPTDTILGSRLARRQRLETLLVREPDMVTDSFEELASFPYFAVGQHF